MPAQPVSFIRIQKKSETGKTLSPDYVIFSNNPVWHDSCSIKGKRDDMDILMPNGLVFSVYEDYRKETEKLLALADRTKVNDRARKEDMKYRARTAYKKK